MTAEQAREKLATRTRMPAGLTKRATFARIGVEEAIAFGRVANPATVLLLGVIRLSGTRWVIRRKGWITFDRDACQQLGLVDGDIFYRAARRLKALDILESRGKPGARLEYRLNPNWAKPKAEVIDLAAARKASRVRRKHDGQYG
jgi:hypothetical protein